MSAQGECLRDFVAKPAAWSEKQTLTFRKTFDGSLDRRAEALGWPLDDVRPAMVQGHLDIVGCSNRGQCPNGLPAIHADGDYGWATSLRWLVFDPKF